TIEYLSNLNLSDKAKLASNMLLMSAYGTEDGLPSGVGDMGQIGTAYGMGDIGQMGAAYGTGDLSQMGTAAQPSEAELAAMLDAWLLNPDDAALLAIYDSSVSPGSYDDNMSAFGLVSMDAPASISIYADSFEGKEGISAAIASYNETADTENQISYTDFVGLLMSSVTTIVNVISYVLIAFVAVSLVVSSIMIGIITFISVLERTKEIGILRAIGASKRNISQVFNAETFIVGAISGLLGVGISYLLLLPINAVIHALTDNSSINAVLPVVSAAVLVLLSMGLTLIAGIIPSKKAAKKDPVIALRTE
ncbi:MAG: FtsX-like permease family protein, partial [Bacillota bacterium]